MKIGTVTLMTDIATKTVESNNNPATKTVESNNNPAIVEGLNFSSNNLTSQQQADLTKVR